MAITGVGLIIAAVVVSTVPFLNVQMLMESIRFVGSIPLPVKLLIGGVFLFVIATLIPSRLK
jgi:hypothetical protein